MTGTYEHVIRLNIQNAIRNRLKSTLPGFNKYISDEIDGLERRLKFQGALIVDNLALSSQKAQRDTITKLKAVRTGRLRDSIRITGEGLEAHVGTSLYYAQNVYDGEGPVWVNGTIQVREYGAGPRPWTERSAGEFEGSIDGIVSDGLSKVL